MYEIDVSVNAAKEIRKLPKKRQSKLAALLEILKEYPYFGKKLSGDHKGQYSLRLWPYRVIYVLDKKAKRVLIVSVKHRQEAYG